MNRWSNESFDKLERIYCRKKVLPTKKSRHLNSSIGRTTTDYGEIEMKRSGSFSVAKHFQAKVQRGFLYIAADITHELYFA